MTNEALNCHNFGMDGFYFTRLVDAPPTVGLTNYDFLKKRPEKANRILEKENGYVVGRAEKARLEARPYNGSIILFDKESKTPVGKIENGLLRTDNPEVLLDTINQSKEVYASIKKIKPKILRKKVNNMVGWLSNLEEAAKQALPIDAEVTKLVPISSEDRTVAIPKPEVYESYNAERLHTIKEGILSKKRYKDNLKKYYTSLLDNGLATKEELGQLVKDMRTPKQTVFNYAFPPLASLFTENPAADALKGMPSGRTCALVLGLAAVGLTMGCLGQAKPTPTPQPSDTPTPTPNVNHPPSITKLSHSWTGGDTKQPWTCSNNTFTAEVSDPDGDKINSINWYDNKNPIWSCLNKTSCETKLLPDGIHTIKLTATDDKGAQTVLEKQIDVKYEVPEPVPLKTKDGVNIATIYVPTGSDPLFVSLHPINDWKKSKDTPLLGFYDTINPVTWDWHIKWALEHGINNLWIYIAPHSQPPDEAEEGTTGIRYKDGFLNSKYKDKISFTAVFDSRTYNPYSEDYNPKDSIEKDVKVLSQYFFNQPNYKKVSGRPVLYLAFSSEYLCCDCNNSKERKEILKQQVELARNTAKKYGYDLFLIGDNSTAFSECDVDKFMIENFDAVTSYSMEGARNPDTYDWKIDEKGRKILIAPYEDLVDNAIKREIELSSLASGTNKTYIPFVEAGFDNEKAFLVGFRDWMIKRTNPTPNKFEEFVTGIKPLIDPKVNTLLTIWNEFCEGNGIEPTKEFGFAYLDIIRDNFAIKPAGGWPPNLVPTKNCGCTEYKNYTSEIGIPGIGGMMAAASENNLLKALVRRRKETQNDKKVYKEKRII